MVLSLPCLFYFVFSNLVCNYAFRLTELSNYVVYNILLDFLLSDDQLDFTPMSLTVKS